MSDTLLNRIYDVKIAGYDDSIQKVKALTDAFNKMDAAKRKLNEQLQKKIEAGDTAAVQQLTARIKDLETSLKNLDKQRNQSAKEIELLAKAELNEAKSLTEAAKAARIKQQADIDANKEIDRQIKNQQKQQQELKATGTNYYALVDASKKALEAYRLFDTSTGDTKGFENVKQKAIEANKAVQDFNRTLSPDGTLVGEYKTGILNAFKDLGLSDVLKKQSGDITNDLGKIKQQTRDLAEQYKKLSVDGGESFNRVDKELKESIQLQQQMEANLQHINTALNQTGSVGGQVTKALKNEFASLKQNISQVVVGYVSFQAVVSGVQGVIRNNAELSDRFVDLKRILNETREGTEAVIESLKKIDTRTSLKGLVDISIIAAKAGVASKDIAGVTKALDELQLVAGKELGNVEQTTTSLVKLINIFEGPGKTTEENIRRYGNAIVELANKGVASGGYLVDYAQRLAGIEGITKIQIESVLGLAAAFEEQGQSGEVAATASTQIISKIGADVEKFAKIAGKTKEAFQDTLRSNPGEALIQVAQGIKGNATAFDEIAPKFAEVEASGVRVQATLGVIADKADFFREKIKIAGVALQDTNAITTGAAEKQETFAATLDKISKQFELIGSNKGVQITLTSVASILAFLLSNLLPIISLLGLYGLGWALANKEMILQRANLLFINAQLVVGRVALAAISIFQTAYNTALSVYTGVARLATVSTTLLGNAMRLLPLGIILTILGLVIASFRAFGNAVTGTTDELRKQAIQQKLLADVQQQAAAAIAEQKAKTEALAKVVGDLSISEATRMKALKDLIAIDPIFQKTLVDGKINTDRLAEALKEYNKNLLEKAKLEAAQSIQGKEYQELVRLQTIKQKLEFRKSGADSKGFGDLTDEEKDFFKNDGIFSLKGFNATSSALNIDVSKETFDKAIKNVDEALKLQNEKVNAATELFSNLYAKNATQPDSTSTGAVAPSDNVFSIFKKLVKSGGTDKEFADLLKNVKEQRDRTNRLSKEYSDLKKLEKQIEDLINPKQSSTRSEKDIAKDPFRLVDAKRDTDLANAERNFLEIKKQREATYKEEVDYNNQILSINTKAINDKLAILARKKTLSAEELKTQAELGKQKVDLEIKNQEQLDALNKKELDRLTKIAERKLEEKNRLAEDDLNEVKNDPNASALDRLNAQQEYNFKLLASQQEFNATMAALELKYSKDSTDTENKRGDAIRNILKSIKEARIKEFEAAMKTIDQLAARDASTVKLKYGQLSKDILDNPNISNSNKKAAVEQIEIGQNVELAAQELKTANDRLKLAEEQYKAGKITKEVYEQYYTAAIQKQLVLNDAVEAGKEKITNLNQLLTNGLRSLFGFGKGSEEEKLLSDTLVKSFDFAKQAMNDFFDAKQARIERDKELTYERIDLEKQQLLNESQSAAEREAIERQAAAKKKEADRLAFEENKKIQKAQAQINLATQLSNLAVIAFAPNPANIATLGIAGAVMYAVQAGLALAGYAININRINSAKFAGGGKVVPMFADGGVADVGNGMITTTPNIPTQSNGDNIFATVKTGEVILNEEQQRRAGGPSFFKALGVPGFASGGYTGIGDFKLGDSLQAPVNPSSFLNPSNNTTISTGMMQTILSLFEATNAQINETSRQVRNIKVQVVAKEVDTTISETKKAEAIGTL